MSNVFRTVDVMLMYGKEAEIKNKRQTASYPKSNFTLDKLSFSLSYGAILGFVGEIGGFQSTGISRERKA